ncbi:MAG: hypothetical protein LBF72_00800 [Holosporales bacterium]|nr:hypothetical protein [Holosporales bacterium]
MGPAGFYRSFLITSWQVIFVFGYVQSPKIVDRRRVVQAKGGTRTVRTEQRVTNPQIFGDWIW